MDNKKSSPAKWHLNLSLALLLGALSFFGVLTLLLLYCLQNQAIRSLTTEVTRLQVQQAYTSQITAQLSDLQGRLSHQDSQLDKHDTQIKELDKARAQKPSLSQEQLTTLDTIHRTQQIISATPVSSKSPERAEQNCEHSKLWCYVLAWTRPLQPYLSITSSSGFVPRPYFRDITQLQGQTCQLLLSQLQIAVINQDTPAQVELLHTLQEQISYLPAASAHAAQAYLLSIAAGLTEGQP